LYVDGATYGVDHARELDQKAITGSSDDATAVLLDLWISERAAQHPQPIERAFLVLTHKPRVTYDIGCQDGRQPPLHPPLTHRSGPAKRRSLSYF
jgi:hypothetical protein